MQTKLPSSRLRWVPVFPGALFCLAASLAAQTAPPTTPAPSTTDSDTVVLSPFEVVSDTKGYYSSNSMSGTRFNSKLKDIPSPITVVTKEQMEDFAMVDINDVFNYTASAEGTDTYTDVTVDRNGSVSDNTQLSPNTANRIRGLASANMSFNNFEMSGRMPIDPVITESIEVSRGPNANVFGLGNPSGTVNIVGATANLSRDRSRVQGRYDSYDGYRTSLDVNRVLVPNKLAIRASVLNAKQGFTRKPSGMYTERYDGMIKFRPFKNTTITAGMYYYHQYGNRPNFVTPRDSVSYWIKSGKPTWDPINEVVHVNGQTLGPFTSDKGLPDYFQRTFTGNGHSYMYIDQNGLGYFSAPTTFGLSKGTLTPNAGAQSVRLMAANSEAGANLGKNVNQPLFTTTPGLVDKSIYDYSKINLAAVNRDWDTDLLSNVQIDQIFLNTPRQTLAAQVAFLREDTQRYRRDYIGIANDNGQSGQLLVDVNERNLDGSPNPYLGRLYIGTDQPRTTYQPLKWDTYRAQLAYKLDLRHDKGWWHWLGMHQFSAYDEYKYRIQRRYSYREAILNNLPWIPAGISRGNQGAISGGPSAALADTRSYLRYYVGDPNTDRVDYAPTDLSPGQYTFNWGSWTMANQSVNGKTYSLPMAGTYQSHADSAQVGLAAVTDATGAGSNTKTILKTAGAVVQSHFLNDRIVTTFGLREDKQYVKFGSSPQQLIYPQGVAFNYDSIDHWAGGDYRFNSGRTTTSGVVFSPFKDTHLVRSMDNGSGIGHFFSGLLNGMFLTYNKSDSFLPQDPKINLFFQPLPNTTGKDKEYGVGFSMLDDRLVVRLNHYETRALNYRQGDASTIAQRVTRIDLTSNKPFLLYTQMESPLVTPSADTTWSQVGWVRQQNPNFSEQQVQDEVAKEMGLSWDTITRIQAAFSSGQIASTQDVTAKGDELEVNYVSPSHNWTLYGTVYRNETVNSNISDDISQWIAQRMKVWTTIEDPRIPDPSRPGHGVLWWTYNYGGSQTAQQNYTSFVQVPFSVVKQQEGKATPQERKYNFKLSTRYSLAGLSENRFIHAITVGGAVRWEDKAAIGYYGTKDANGIYTDLDTNRPIYDSAHTFVDAFISYRVKLWGGRLPTTFQLNVKNLNENGGLQPIAADPDGTPNTYRIVDPRQFILTATFDF
ncbi:MAG TPA: TonB-dependent receptor plug domain-containing protein [Opitutaceae bacterium]|nr:TonB-dependent receptor plug domain-containing protein [Opitutaceae bacterium]